MSDQDDRAAALRGRDIRLRRRDRAGQVRYYRSEISGLLGRLNALVRAAEASHVTIAPARRFLDDGFASPVFGARITADGESEEL